VTKRSPRRRGDRAVPPRDAATIRVAVDGFFLVQDYVEVKDGKTVFRGHGIFGWDAPAADVHLVLVRQHGTGPVATVARALAGRHAGVRIVEPAGAGRYTYRFEGESTYHFKLENSFDGGQKLADVHVRNVQKNTAS
jgi:hypothetical protein